MANLFIRLLGPFEVMLNGKRKTAFRSDKERALLTYLCLETKVPHRREKLAGLLWPDYPESTARTYLRNALANLRKVIRDRLQNRDKETSPNFLYITRQTIQFNIDSDAWVDVLAFLSTLEKSQATVAELEAAVACYRDDFMAGFSLADSNLFEEWLVIQRERFKRLAFYALYQLVEAYTTQGEYKQALVHARRMVMLDPLRERAQQCLMRLLTYNGQTNQALVQYETYASLLADEIGVSPLEETTRLYLQIRDGTLTIPDLNQIYLPAFLKGGEGSPSEQTVFVGFERELARLDHFLDQAMAGQGQVVFIVGEPGSGKTSLGDEFLQQAMKLNQSLLAVKGRCNAYTGFGDPYLPFLEIMEMFTGEVETRWAGGEISRQEAQRLWNSMPDVLGALLENGPDLIDRFIPGAELLARAQAGAIDQVSWLSEILDQRRIRKFQSENLQQSDLFKQYTKALQKLSHQHPIVLMVDDLQWADPGSIGLLFHLGRRLSGSRILLIGAYRPEEIAIGRMTETGQERHPLATVVHELQLEYGDIFIDLNQTEGRKFINAFMDTEPNRLSEAFRDVLFEHTNGHPLFTVELLRGLQNRGDLIKDEAGRWIANPSLNWQSIPPRVEAVIAERFGRLPGEWQSMLAAASVEGEEFTAEAVARVEDIDESQVLAWLSGPLSKKHHLVKAQDLNWIGEQRLSQFRFRHFLFQRYLYNQLDPVQQSRLHHLTGRALEDLYGDQVEEMAVVLARHYEMAGMKLHAAKYLLKAGKRATRLFAYQEAITHLKHGINLIETLPETAEHDQLVYFLLLALALPVEAIRGPVSELEQIFTRARYLSQSIEPSEELFHALEGLVSYYRLSLELEKGLQFAQEMLIIARRLERSDLLVIAHHNLSIVHFYLGRADDFLETQKGMTALFEAERECILENQNGFIILSDSLSHAAWALNHLGYPEQSEQRITALIELAKNKNHPFLKAEAYMCASFSFWSRRQVEKTQKFASETIAISRQHDYSYHLGSGLGVMGWAVGEEGKLDEGIEKIRQGLALLKDSNSRLIYQHLLVLLADTYLKAGMVDEGLTVIDESLALINKSAFKVIEPEICRLKGELLLLKEGLETGAEACFQRAIEVAKGQKAKSWELRATMSLCRLLKNQGKVEKARRRLSEIYNWFTEGFETPDLKEAKSLLEALS